MKTPRKTALALGAAAAALSLTAVTAQPAGAVSYDAEIGCNAKGTTATLDFTQRSNIYKSMPVRLQAWDTAADGHHSSVRLVTKTATGATHHWRWHANYGGNNTYRVFTSSAQDSKGITRVGVQGGTFEGGDLLSLCTYWTPR